MTHATAERGGRRRNGALALTGLAWLVLLSGCSGLDSRSTATAPEPATLPSAAPLEGWWPISQQRYRTTAGTLYLGNLDARIAALQPAAERGQTSAKLRLAAALYHRFKLGARLDDFERALALVESITDNGSQQPEVRLLHAVMLNGMHRFAEAAALLQQTSAGDPAARRQLEADLRTAWGDYAALADDFAHSSEPIADFYQLAHRADLRLLLGDLNGALQLYRAAQSLYRDVNPVPLAWLHTQVGIAYLRVGRIDDARRFFAAAVERLPGYILAEEHLAETEFLQGDLSAARQRYLRVIEQTNDPQFIAALAALEQAAGNQGRADALWQRAETGWQQRLASHPQAFAQHAAEYFLERGQPVRALEWAESNLRGRHDIGSWILLARSADAAGHSRRACAALREVDRLRLQPPELAELQPLRQHCPG